MARSKSIPGSKSSRPNTNKEQNGAAEPNRVPDLKAVAETAPAASHEANLKQENNRAALLGAVPAAEVAPEPKLASEPRVTSEPKPAPDPRKFEVMKPDGRKNVVPINLDEEIRRRAYELYQQRGVGSGSEAEDWLTAEREVRQRYRQQSA